MPVENDSSNLKRDKMIRIIDDLQSRIAELDELKKDLNHNKISFASSPNKSKEMLEEIVVPPLELLKESRKK